MQEKELLYKENSYEFKYVGGYNNSYVFETDSAVKYEAQFKPSPYVLGDAAFASFVYEFVLFLKEEIHSTIQADPRVAFTVVSIILNFYEGNDNNVCVYICDSSDGKQLARARKFNYWFAYFNEGGFIQMTEVFKDTDGTKYPIGLILKVKNIFRAQIIEAFATLASEYNKE